MYEGQCVTECVEGDGQGKGIKGTPPFPVSSESLSDV